MAREQANVTPEKLPLKAGTVSQMCPIFTKKPEIHEEVEEFAAKLAQRGLTREQRSNWRANIVLLKKKDGTKRFAIDYRRLNEQSTTISYPMPPYSRDICQFKWNEVFLKSRFL